MLKIILNPADSLDKEMLDYANRLDTDPSFCEKHPYQETVLIVSRTSKYGIVHVQSICCQDFRNQLIEKHIVSPLDQS